MIRSIAVLVVVAITAPSYLHASDLEINGFISQGGIYTSDNRYYGTSEGLSFQHSEIGAGFVYTVSDTTHVSAQFVKRTSGRVYNDDLRVDYLNVNQSLINNNQTHLHFQFGRIKPPIGLYNELRDSPAARRGIWMPQSIYVEGLGLRELYTGLDGAILTGSYFTEGVDFDFDLTLAQRRELKQRAQVAFLGSQNPGELSMGEAGAARLIINWLEPDILFSATWLHSLSEYEPSKSQRDPLNEGDVTTDSLMVGLEKNFSNVSLTAEGVYRHIKPQGFDLPHLRDVRREAGYYLEMRYHPNSKLSLFGRYDALYRDIDDRDGSTNASLSDASAHRFYQRQFGLGFRWKISPHWLLHGEWHTIDGTAATPPPDNPQFRDGGGKSNWQLYGLQISFIF